MAARKGRCEGGRRTWRAGLLGLVVLVSLWLVAKPLSAVSWRRGLESSSESLFNRRLMVGQQAGVALRGGGGGGAPPLRPPWDPLLTRSDLLRGQAYYGSGDRLQAVAAKLLAGQEIKVYAIGGSVTKGSGSSDAATTSFPARLFQLINATFPHPGHVFVNKGIGATSSGIFSACVEKMVAQGADLVISEFTLNDQEDEEFVHPQRQGYEQLLRKLLLLPHRPAIIQVHSYAWWRAEGDKVGEGLFYWPAAEEQFTVFAHYYDLPVVSVRAALHPLFRDDVPGFKTGKVWSKWNRETTTGGEIPRAAEEEQDEYWYYDRTHPNDRGHAMMAELVGGVLARALDEQARGVTAQQLGAWPVARSGASGEGAADEGAAGGSAEGKEGFDELPPPMVPGNAEAPTSLCAIQEDFKSLVVDVDGFEYKPERPKEATFVGQKWGWTGNRPGSTVDLLFDTRADTAAKKQVRGLATVYLTHLKGYKRMGTAEVACVAGCTCDPTILDGTWEQEATLMQIHSFKVTQHRACRVRVTIRKQPGAVPQAGHKVSLQALMVSHYPLRLDQNKFQAKDVAARLTEDAA